MLFLLKTVSVKNMEIEEKKVCLTTLENEPETIQFVNKKTVANSNGLVFDLLELHKVIKKAKATGKEYAVYQLLVQDSFDKYNIDNVFRKQMLWKGQNPKRIKVSVTQEGEFYNWKIEAA